MTQLKASARARAALDARTETPVDGPRLAASYADDAVPPRRIARLSEPTPEQIAEREAAKARLSALRSIADDYARTSGIDFVQACTALATGMVRDGRVLRALAPTAQLGEMAAGRGRNPGWISPRQLSALSLFHDLHMARLIGCGSVDLERPRVQGGGAGDMMQALIHGADAAKAYSIARESFCAPAVQRIVDWVVILDRPIDDFSLSREFPLDKRDYVKGARRVLLLQGAWDLARHFRI
jgi:hypothetical protein